MRNRGTNIFKLIADSAIATHFGRIHWQSNMWALIGGKWDRKRIRNYSSGKELFSTDKSAVLVKKPCTNWCPSPPADGFYRSDEHFYVPRIVCKECQHHRERRPGVPFPQCALLASKTPALSAAKEFANTIDEAKQKAEGLLRGEPLL